MMCILTVSITILKYLCKEKKQINTAVNKDAPIAILIPWF